MELYSYSGFSKEQGLLLENYVTNVASSTYCFNNIPQEVLATLLAYASRSPNTFKENLLTMLTEEGMEWAIPINECFDTDKAQEFHEKWTLRFGHNSIKKFANIAFACDNISILATKVLEDTRFASFIEKSTRYRSFETYGSNYYIPSDAPSPVQLKIAEACDLLFGVYAKWFPKVVERLKEWYPKKKHAFLAPKVCDILRYLLPLASNTCVGGVANALAYTDMCTKLLSHDMEECKDLGKALLREGKEVCPTLLNHARRSRYRTFSRNSLNAIYTQEPELFIDPEIYAYENSNKAMLVEYPSTLAPLFKSLLYRFSGVVYDKLEVPEREWERILLASIDERENHDSLLREFETLNFTFEITMDYGAYRDLQRHNITMQLPQLFSPYLGYEEYKYLKDIDPELERDYRQVMDHVMKCYQSISIIDKHTAQYCLPLAYRQRLIYQCNLRELAYIIKLRSTQAGHWSYRNIVQQMYDKVVQQYPILKTVLDCDFEPSFLMQPLE